MEGERAMHGRERDECSGRDRERERHAWESRFEPRASVEQRRLKGERGVWSRGVCKGERGVGAEVFAREKEAIGAEAFAREK